MLRYRFAVAFLCIASTTVISVADELEPKTILERALRAHGGKRTLERQKAPMMWMERGTFYGMGAGQPFVAQYASKWPNWYRQEIENAFSITINGDKAWVKSSAGTQLLKGDQLAEQLKQVRSAWAVRLFPLTDKKYELSTIAGVKVNGQETVGLLAKHAKNYDLKFYFDKKSFLLLKFETMVVSPQHGPKPVLSEAIYSAHKSFGGGKVPGKIKMRYDRKLFVEAETVDYKIGATLDPNHFQVPKD